MTRSEALQIIKQEELKFFNWFDDHELKTDELGIKFQNNEWIVYATTERANIGIESIFNFNNESEALQNFIKRLRALNKL